MAEVRKFQAGDVAQIRVLGKAMHADSKYSHIPYVPERVDSFVEWLTDNKDSVGFVAVADDGEIVGMAAFELRPYFFAKGRIAQDFAFYVKPSWRTTRVFTMLVYAGEEWAKEQFAHALVLGVTAVDVEKVTTMCNKMGYAPWGTLNRKELMQ